MTDFTELEAALEADDEELPAALSGPLEGVDEEVGTLLAERPDLYRTLVTRVSKLAAADELVAEHPETADRFLATLWGGLAVIAREAPSVRAEIDDDYRVQWDADDSDAEWYAETDAEAGRVAGGPGRIDDPDVTFTGETATLFGMLGDDEFDPQQAFMQGAFGIDGDLPTAMAFGETMDAVQRRAEDLED